MRRSRGLMLLAGVLLAAPSGCGGEPDAGTNNDRPDTVRTQNATPRTPPTKPAENGGSDKSSELPDLVGKGLQFAQDRAQAAGFERLWSHDVTGRSREQIDDRGWRVCFQEPSAGSVDPSTQIDFGVVKLDEQCPETDQSKDQPTVDDGKLPDFSGESVEVAHRALGLDASVSVEDASGEDRTVWIERNWRVCSQSPEPGTTWDGEPVTLRAVKYGESCP